MRESQVIVTTHGAALANSIFAAPGTNVIELFPVRRINLDLYPNLSRIFELRHQSILVPTTKYRQSLRVDLSLIESALSNCSQNNLPSPHEICIGKLAA